MWRTKAAIVDVSVRVAFDGGAVIQDEGAVGIVDRKTAGQMNSKVSRLQSSLIILIREGTAIYIYINYTRRAVNTKTLEKGISEGCYDIRRLTDGAATFSGQPSTCATVDS